MARPSNTCAESGVLFRLTSVRRAGLIPASVLTLAATALAATVVGWVPPGLPPAPLAGEALCPGAFLTPE
jgi:hypothetical protein